MADRGLVTTPGNEHAKGEQMPPFNRWNFANIEKLGTYEKNLPSVYYIAPPTNRAHRKLGQLFVGYAYAEGWPH